MKYMAPEIEVLELDVIDVIQTSTVTDPENSKEPPTPGDNDLPVN